jgi:hypothetical protein
VANQFEKEALPRMMHHAQTKQLYLFDNVVFNLVSLFDYTANLSGYQYFGRNQRKWKWKGLMVEARKEAKTEGQTGKLHKEFARRAIEINQNWVSKLSERRARVYHDSPDNSEVSATMDFSDFNKSSLIVAMPDSFKKWMDRSTSAPCEAKESIVGGTSWCVYHSFLQVENLVRILLESLPEKDEWVTS